MLVLLNKEIQGNGKGFGIGAVSIIDNGAPVDSFLHFEAHGYRLKPEHPAGRNIRAIAHQQHDGPAVHGIFKRGGIRKRNGNLHDAMLVDSRNAGIRFTCLRLDNPQPGILIAAPVEKIFDSIRIVSYGVINLFVIAAKDKGFAITVKF